MHRMQWTRGSSNVFPWCTSSSLPCFWYRLLHHASQETVVLHPGTCASQSERRPEGIQRPGIQMETGAMAAAPSASPRRVCAGPRALQTASGHHAAARRTAKRLGVSFNRHTAQGCGKDEKAGPCCPVCSAWPVTAPEWPNQDWAEAWGPVALPHCWRAWLCENRELR